MPTMFEFNVNMLTFIANEVYTCKFGTFLCNSQRERVKYNLKDKTVSMWTYINHYATDLFTNPFYLKPPMDPSTGQYEYARIPRIPTVLYHDITLWKDLFLRYSLDNPRYSGLHKTVSLTEDYKESLMRE